MNTQKPRSNEPRVNGEISAGSVRLVDENGGMVGVVSIQEALKRADNAGLDLVEVSPLAEPPVCKIINYGKYKYELQKKAAEARKKQKVISIKEIKLRPNIDKNDLNIKMRSIHKFIEEGDKVKITLRFRGREVAHLELGMNLLNKIQEELGEAVRIESPPRMEGRQAVMLIGPK